MNELVEFRMPIYISGYKVRNEVKYAKEKKLEEAWAGPRDVGPGGELKA